MPNRQLPTCFVNRILLYMNEQPQWQAAQTKLSNSLVCPVRASLYDRCHNRSSAELLEPQIRFASFQASEDLARRYIHVLAESLAGRPDDFVQELGFRLFVRH